MEFNSYIWQLYKNSADGIETIQKYSNLLRNIVNGNFTLVLANVPNISSEKDWEFSELVINKYSDTKVLSFSEAEDIFVDVMTDFPGAYFDEDTQTEENFVLGHDDILDYLSELSVGLYTCFPEYFFPYFFQDQFNLFQRICNEFNIPLPEVPSKKNFDERLAYYFELCRVLYEFRNGQGFSPEEMCAFLYSFAPKSILIEQEADLPEPMRVWIVGAGINDNGDAEILDEADESFVTTWQGNVDTRRGDIVLMYCLAPRSYVHSIWRAKFDGFVDPFKHFYSQIWVCNPIKTAHVTFADLRSDPILSQNGLIKRNMVGLNGFRLGYREYEAILKIMESKGQDLSILPHINGFFGGNAEQKSLKDERDVEIQLVEPLLKRLGYEDEDWTRQMTVRMGSGEKVFPDYAFFPKQKKGEEQAKMILETKYRIKTRKELFKAYWQAKSYALRLESQVFMVAAVEGVWIFRLGDRGFGVDNHAFHDWREIYQPDHFASTVDLVGKQTIKKLAI